MAHEGRDSSGKFITGHKVCGGRAGTASKLTRDLKHSIIEAAVAHGNDGKGKGGLQGCCQWLLREHPKLFVRYLLAKLLPVNVHGDVDVSIGETSIIVMAAPPGHFVRAEEISKTVTIDAAAPPASAAPRPAPPPAHRLAKPLL